MNSGLQVILHTVLIGIGATLVMDVWMLILKRFNVSMLSYALLGRWLAHGAKGKWFHPSIQKAEPIKQEVVVGWFAHYAIGVLFAALLVLVFGATWIKKPALAPAVSVGLITALVPLFVMQPAMGAGVLSRKTAQPIFNVIKSLTNHFVFGCGLFLTGIGLSRLLVL